MEGQEIADFLALHLKTDDLDEGVEIQMYGIVYNIGFLSLMVQEHKEAQVQGRWSFILLQFEILFSYNLNFSCTNNQVKYEALVIFLEQPWTYLRGQLAPPL